MTVTFIDQPVQKLATQALIVPLSADVSPERMPGFDTNLAAMIAQLNRHGDWKGELGEVAVFYSDNYQGREALTGIKRIIVVGMGKSAEWQYEKMRKAVAAGISALKSHKLKEGTVYLPANVSSATAKDLATIAVLASWQFDHYKTLDRKERVAVEEINFVLASNEEIEKEEYEQAVADGLAIGQATNYVRELTNHPANQMTPTRLGKIACELADTETTTVRVYDRSQIEQLGMGAMLAVAAGSMQEPQLIVVEYKPAGSEQRTVNSKQKLPKIGLVGKGVTFDSGGISIKPSDGMEEMKMDMAGAATCLGAIAAAKALQLPVHLVAVLPATENMPSGSATKPGDIVKAYDGKTIEILNTDAEGRLVLADALAFIAKEHTPDAIIDLATLTGAVVIALGHEASAILGNNAELMEKVKASAGRTGERVWELPLWDEHREMVKSQIADIKNLGKPRQAGTSNGAAFLDYFVPKEIPWVHIDIAGTALLDEARAYMPKGGSGWGVRLLVDLLEHWD